jgi:hypothetical protein
MFANYRPVTIAGRTGLTTSLQADPVQALIFM